MKNKICQNLARINNLSYVLNLQARDGCKTFFDQNINEWRIRLNSIREIIDYFNQINLYIDKSLGHRVDFLLNDSLYILLCSYPGKVAINLDRIAGKTMKMCQKEISNYLKSYLPIIKKSFK